MIWGVWLGAGGKGELYFFWEKVYRTTVGNEGEEARAGGAGRSKKSFLDAGGWRGGLCPCVREGKRAVVIPLHQTAHNFEK